MVVNSFLPLLVVIIPIIGALIIGYSDERDARLRNTVALLTSLATFAVVASMVPLVTGGQILELQLLRLMETLELIFRVDSFGIVFGFISSLLWIFTVIYSFGYMAREHDQKRYFTFFILSLSATMGVAFTGNLFSLYIFYEYLTLCTYPLVIHEGTPEAIRAGTKYIIYGFAGGALVLFSFIVLRLTLYQGIAESLNFTAGGVFHNVTDEYRLFLTVIFFICVAGFSTKAAIMPLHSWLPSAMVAPTPVSALLHAVAVVKAGVFGVLRVMYSVYGVELMQELGVTDILAWVICFTILAASTIALKQNVLKLRLAYSTISQLAYITLGAIMLTPCGLTGGVIHIINHALMKITLFFCAGTIITITGKTRIDELNGVGRRLPLVMIAFAIGGLGLIGILPINGYISKFFLLEGSLEAGKPVFAAVILISALLNSMYYLPIIVNAFFKKGSFENPRGLEAPLTMLVPTVILAVLCVVVGIYAHRTTIPLIAQVVNTSF